jgi:Resolvase, N terminal domain
MQARIAAAEQLYGVMCSAPTSCPSRCSDSPPRRWSGRVRPCGPGRAPAPPPRPRHPVDSGPPLAPAPGRARPARHSATSAGVLGRSRADSAARVGVETAGQLLVTAGDNPSACAQRPPSRICAAPPPSGVLGSHRPPPAEPWRRPPSQQRLVADRPGPHALPPADQGLCRAPDQTRPVQARHHALAEALHRPRDLPPAHKPATHRPTRLPEIGGINHPLSQVLRRFPAWTSARPCPRLHHRPATPAPDRRPRARRLLPDVHETASGARADRPTLAQVLDQLRPGDTLVVWKLDRLGRSLWHLVDTITSPADRGIGFRSLQEAIESKESLSPMA